MLASKAVPLTLANRVFPLAFLTNQLISLLQLNDLLYTFTVHNTLDHKALITSHSKNKWSTLSTAELHSIQSLESVPPHSNSFSLVISMFFNANHMMNECLGKLLDAQTIFCPLQFSSHSHQAFQCTFDIELSSLFWPP